MFLGLLHMPRRMQKSFFLVKFGSPSFSHPHSSSAQDPVRLLSLIYTKAICELAVVLGEQGSAVQEGGLGPHLEGKCLEIQLCLCGDGGGDRMWYVGRLPKSCLWY